VAQAEELLVDRGNVLQAFLVIDDRHAFERVREKAFENVVGKVHGTEEIKDGLARGLTDHNQISLLELRDQKDVSDTVQDERLQTPLSRLIQPSLVPGDRPDPPVAAYANRYLDMASRVDKDDTFYGRVGRLHVMDPPGQLRHHLLCL
jgi:hypothetical protein